MNKDFGGRDLDPERRIVELREALEQAEARVRYLENLAHIDVLTEILNRRGFMRELERVISYAKRYSVPATLVLLDLDHFKAVNDHFGHPVGDVVLIHFARILTRSVRSSDIAARLGGDEFALILMHAAPAGAAQLMNSLQQRLRETPANVDGITIPVGVSAGIAAIEADSRSQYVLDEADRSLYAAKLSRGGAPRR